MSVKYLETTGKTEEDAIQKALRQLHLERDEVSVEVLARAKTGFLGIGSSPAKIKVSYEVADEPAPRPEPVAAPAAPAPASAPAPVAAEKPAPVKEAPKAKKSEPAAEPVPAVSVTPAAPATPAAAEKAEKVEKTEKPVQKKPRKDRKKPPVREPAPVKATPAEKAAPAPEPVFSAPAEDDEIAAQITQFLAGLMTQLEVEATPAIQVSDTGVYSVELVGESLGALIGRRGETLDAIQQLTNYSVNRGQSKRVRIHLDAEGYRSKREESLQRLAQKTANKAIKYRRNMMLEPMNAYERHVIHAALQDYDPCISTYSTGTEPNRRLVVAYSRNGR